MTDCGTEAVAAAFRSVGIAATALPSPDRRTLELGSRHLTGDECLPAKVTLGDFLKVTEAPDFDPARVAFFMPATEGPCRFGQYGPSIRNALRDAGFPDALLVSPTTGNGYDTRGISGSALR
jgi:predicted nucleotide-binding protein (sugar kinase/HSP70/actin superfamily)